MNRVTQWFNCWQCGRTKANEYSECAYCGGDVVVMIDERQSMISCPCCKGSGFVDKTGSVIDEIRALEWRGPGTFSCCPWCGGFEVHGHESECKCAAILRRLK